MGWIPIGFLLDFHEISMEFLWHFYGMDSCGISLGFLWDFHDISLGFL